MTLSVEEQLHLAEYHRQAANATECRMCGHRYIDHVGPVSTKSCWWPRSRLTTFGAPCRCKAFADPAIYPPAEQLVLEDIRKNRPGGTTQ